MSTWGKIGCNIFAWFLQIHKLSARKVPRENSFLRVPSAADDDGNVGGRVKIGSDGEDSFGEDWTGVTRFG